MDLCIFVNEYVIQPIAESPTKNYSALVISRENGKMSTRGTKRERDVSTHIYCLVSTKVSNPMKIKRIYGVLGILKLYSGTSRLYLAHSSRTLCDRTEEEAFAWKN